MLVGASYGMKTTAYRMLAGALSGEHIARRQRKGRGLRKAATTRVLW